MGHYRSEMQCNTCGSMSCTCPPKRTSEDRTYILNEAFDVVPATSVPIFKSYKWPHYTSVKLALAARPEAIRQALAANDEALRQALSAHRERTLSLANASKNAPKVTRAK